MVYIQLDVKKETDLRLAGSISNLHGITSIREPHAANAHLSLKDSFGHD